MSLRRCLYTSALMLVMPSLARSLATEEIYSVSHCAGTPNIIKMVETDNCVPQACTQNDLGGYNLFVAATCNVKDRFQYSNERLHGFDYVMMEEYKGDGCDRLVQTTIFPAWGTCERSSTQANTSNIVSLYPNGTVVILEFTNENCRGSPSLTFTRDKESLTSSKCYQNQYKFFAGTGSGRAASSSSKYSYANQLQGGTDGSEWIIITAIVIGSVVIVALLAFAAFKFGRRRYDDNFNKDKGLAALATSYAGFPTPESALKAITLAPEAIKELGMVCVSINPKERPCASEALYKLHTIIAQGL
ncbi:hypothetical protein CCR75_002569 [Bremia lactucae]|uniref:TKL protein kinase n=1 Tax=Bremia lactucae TaxID=4779 RepID=A0A976FMW0_BRELC|nr:hypothetical protein CCR75_002569 [Bremia lactucae]